jgi:mono/diheme cytochrome c family protein
MKPIALLSLLALLLSGCASSPTGDIEQGSEPETGGISEVPNPTPEMAKKSGKSLEQLQRGHAIYMLNCAQCHAYPLPEDLDDAEFTETVPKVVKHAGLGTTEGSDVLSYILAVKKM